MVISVLLNTSTTLAFDPKAPTPLILVTNIPPVMPDVLVNPVTVVKLAASAITPVILVKATTTPNSIFLSATLTLPELIETTPPKLVLPSTVKFLKVRLSLQLGADPVLTMILFALPMFNLPKELVALA